jgi:hypothetical protein
MMPKYTFDTILRLRFKHRRVPLAVLAAEVAARNALIGDIVTLAIGQDETLRDARIEIFDEGHG